MSDDRPHRPRAPAPRDHRPVGGRRAADGERRRALSHHVQRRDLQLPRAAARARRQGLRLPIAERHRGAAASLRGPRAGDGARAARHVRLRIWDEPKQELFLARDPLGIKPLYYADDGRTLRFASQVKALLAAGTIDTAAEPAGSVGFLSAGLVPEPFTLYRAIRALPAGLDAARSAGRQHVPAAPTSTSAKRCGAAPNGAHARRDREALAAAVRDSRQGAPGVRRAGRHLSFGGHRFGHARRDSRAETGAADLHAMTLGFREFRGTPNDEAPLASDVAPPLRHPAPVAMDRARGFRARSSRHPRRRWTSRRPTASTPTSSSRAAAGAASRSRSPAWAATSSSAAIRAFARCRASSGRCAGRGISGRPALRHGSSAPLARPRWHRPSTRGCSNTAARWRSVPAAPRAVHAVGARRSARPRGSFARVSTSSTSSPGSTRPCERLAHVARAGRGARALVVHAQSAAARCRLGRHGALARDPGAVGRCGAVQGAGAVDCLAGISDQARLREHPGAAHSRCRQPSCQVGFRHAGARVDRRRAWREGARPARMGAARAADAAAAISRARAASPTRSAAMAGSPNSIGTSSPPWRRCPSAPRSSACRE